MMSVTDPRTTRIAVFIDFDNVEIGVKSTIGGQFDIGLVLEAIKERGEIVTKIAYSDWKRAGDYSRLLTQHAIRMVQRNLTPGGDKNGADITMALDALEMAFTHDHINAFVIVGGDSDFISLVEKLKQYGRKVIVVGGRQFTSVTMQRNCHEFIAYENLVGGSRGSRSSGERGTRHASTSDIAKALPIVRRALKVLSEREVTPQLGLLKSTLLQLDSTFSEREYGASSFRDFMDKVADTGLVTLKNAGRSMLVELNDDGAGDGGDADGAGSTDTSVDAARLDAQPGQAPAQPQPVASAAHADGAVRHAPAAPRPAPPAAHRAPAMPQADVDEDEETIPPSPMSMQDGIRAVQQAFSGPNAPTRWPMYVRQAKAFLRNAIDGFDERQYGFASVVDLLRAAGREGVVRIERDRQGAVRVFPGPRLGERPAGAPEHGSQDSVDRDDADGVDGAAHPDGRDQHHSHAPDRFAAEAIDGDEDRSAVQAEPVESATDADRITDLPILDAEPIDEGAGAAEAGSGNESAEPEEAESKRPVRRRRTPASGATKAVKGTKAKATRSAAARKTKTARSR